MSRQVETHTAAQGYATRRWPVIPVKGDKSPLTKHGLKDATVDHEQIHRWWSNLEQEVAGVAIVTGAPSGLIVLDIDTHHGGEEPLSILEREHGKLPETVEAGTGGGGRHLYFKRPGHAVPNSAGRLGRGLDVRGDGGYVVAPPSLHPSHKRYEWLRSPDECDPADIPSWLLQLMQSRPRQTAESESHGTIQEGRRNDRLTSFAGQMRRLGLERPEIEAALLARNDDRCKPPLEGAEVGRIAESVSGYEPGVEQGDDDHVLLVQTAKEIVETPDPPNDGHLLGPLVVRSARTVIGAHTGEGKTTIALQMIWAVTTRSEFLDWTGAGGRALVIDGEQGLRTVKRRLREANLGESTQVDYLRVPDGLALDAEGNDVDQLEAILANGRYDLVLADPLYKLHRGDSNEERHAIDLMRRLDEWRDRFEFGLILLVHRRKVQPQAHGFKMDDLFGSSAYLRGAEVVLGLRRPTPGYAHLHIFKDRDGDLPAGEKWGLLFDRDQGFRRDPDDGKEKEVAIDKVRAALEGAPDGLTFSQLTNITGYSEKTVRGAVQNLDAEATTGPNGAKTWRLANNEETDR
jgi:hypothetical protein